MSRSSKRGGKRAGGGGGPQQRAARPAEPEDVQGGDPIDEPEDEEAAEEPGGPPPDTRCAVLLLAGDGPRLEDIPGAIRAALETADADADGVGRTDLEARPRLFWDACVGALSAADPAGLEGYLSNFSNGAIGYALLPEAEVARLAADDRRFKVGDSGTVFRFERPERPPFRVCGGCPCAYRRHLVRLAPATADVYEAVEVRRLEEASLANVFVHPVFAGTRDPLADDQLAALFERKGDETRSRIPWGLLLPPVTYPRRPADGSGHAFDRATVEAREYLLDALPDSVRRARAGAALELARDHLLNPALAGGGRVALEVLPTPRPRTDAVVEHPPTAVARYARSLLEGRGLPGRAPRWAPPARQALCDRVTGLLSPGGEVENGQVRWKERVPEPGDEPPTAVRFRGYDVALQSTKSPPQRVVGHDALPEAEWLAAVGLQGVVGDFLGSLGELELLGELRRLATSAGPQVIVGGVLANAAQLFFTPVSGEVYRDLPADERWWWGGQLLNALLTADQPDLGACVRTVLQLAARPEELVGEVSGAYRLVSYPDELGTFRRLVWYVTPLDWRCQPIARLTGRRGGLRLPFRPVGCWSDAGESHG
jgi:hypothetical protein